MASGSRTDRQMLVLSFLSSFHSLWDPNLWEGSSHRQSGSSRVLGQMGNVSSGLGWLNTWLSVGGTAWGILDDAALLGVHCWDGI